MREWLANTIALAIYIVRFLWRNKIARTVILFASAIYILNPILAGEIWLIVSRLGFAMMFMVVQFGALFWFISRSKTLTVVPGDKGQLTMEDYRGQPVLTKMMGQWITILRGDKAFKAMGGEPPTGLLLAGPPGTGKTHLMKCLAGTAGVAMHATEGSAFRAMFIGVDVMKMLSFIRKSRNLAREHGACIAYIDEVDSVGASRGGATGGMMGGMMGGGQGALTALLSAISGMGEERTMTTLQNKVRRWFLLPPKNEGYVMFVGGTNRPEVLDPALVRAGRLDRTVRVDPPDGPGRKDIFTYYIGKVKHLDIDIDTLVGSTHGITPASIEVAITRDAVRNARFDNRAQVNQIDIEWALVEQQVGLANEIGDMPEAQRLQVATHEAGHSVASYHLRKDMRLAFVSIVRRGSALGFMLPVSKEGTYAIPLSHIVADIRVSMAGDVATKVVLGERWTGAASDIEHIRNRMEYLAWHGVFGESGTKLHDLAKSSQDVASKFERDQWDETEKLMTKHRDQVEALAAVLMEKGELAGGEATRIIESVGSVGL